MGAARHRCLIYEGSPAKYLREVVPLIIDQLNAHVRCLYLNSPPMVAGIRSYLAAAGLDVAREVERGALVLSSDQDHLVNGGFDVDRMLDMLQAAVLKALDDGYRGLWASGDMTWELGGDRRMGYLLAYECGLEDLFREQPALSGICQYHVDTLPASAVHQALRTHRTVYVNEMMARFNPFYCPDDVSDPYVSLDTQEKMLSWMQQRAC